MKIKYILGVIILIILVLCFKTITNNHLHETKKIAKIITAIPSILTATPGIPQKIEIAKIDISAQVEQVGQDRNGRMETPVHALDTGWYSLGFRPGQNGNAVVDGHLDTITGAPAAFWNIKNLLPGDKIIVTDTSKKSYTFTVTKTMSYPYNKVPLQQIFAQANKPHLNLITCTGTWDKLNQNYSNRLVVYAEIQ